ncbi:MAG: zinc-dependent metalloprotease [Acidobacteriota bacterium]|nr:zinc-dependent metalloprotease [Acidobacteriota bacterium]
MWLPLIYRRALVVSALAIVSSAASGGTAPKLFEFVSGPADPTGGRIEIVAAERIVVDVSAIEKDPPSIRMPLLDGASPQATRTEFERRGAENITWRGRFDTPGGGRVTLTVLHGVVVGFIQHADRTYIIEPVRGGGHAQKEINQDLYPECGGVELPGETAFHLEDPDPEIAHDSGARIDVMVMYTPEARDAAGGVAAIEVTAQAAVDIANTAFEDSNVVTRFNLVHAAVTSHHDTGNLSTDLNWLRAEAAVDSLRNAYGADLVSLMVEDGGGFCGLGYVMQSPGAWFADWAFQVTDRGCAVGNLSWAHEHGHNMGMEHDPANGATSASASYPWSFGHFVDGSYRTVMSYSNQCLYGCTRVSHFSNPDVLHAGAATGIAGQRDNHRTADLTAPIVANFRAQTCSIDLHYALQNHTITTAETHEACRSITAGPDVTVTSTGNLTLRAGESITLDDGFSVESGGRFTAEIDPGLGSP